MAFFRGDTKSGFGLQGERALRKLLKELGPRIERKVTRQAMRKAARPIVTAARANARRLLGTRTEDRVTIDRRKTRRTGKVHFRRRRRAGQLERSIGSRQKTYTAQGVVFTAIGPKWPQGAHGYLVEYGHKPSGWYAKQERAQYVPAKPFMRPAYESHKQEALALAIREHRARIEREAQKASYHARAGKVGATWGQILAGGR